MARDFSQSSEQFLQSIDAEIERLQAIRTQIADALGSASPSARPGQPKRKGMSEEGRRKIAEAQKARWAKQKSGATQATKRSAAKPTAPKKVASAKSNATRSASKTPAQGKVGAKSAAKKRASKSAATKATASA